MASGGASPPGVVSPQQQMMMSQMEAMQRMQYAAAMARQPFPGMPFPGMPGMPGMPMMGMQAGMGKGMAMPGMNPYMNSFFDPAKGKGKKGFSSFKGKGKGKGFKGKGKKGEDGEKAEGEGAEGEGKGEWKGKGKGKDSRISPIVNAQREARARFEKDVLDRIQGRWTDEADPNTSYTVEGNICSVSSGDGSRGFRNRLSVYGVEMCWDARRFWHYLNLQELFKAGDAPEKLEWNPAKDSPPTQQIVWLKAEDLPEEEEKKEEEGEEGEEKKEEEGEKKEEEKAAAPAEGEAVA